MQDYYVNKALALGYRIVIRNIKELMKALSEPTIGWMGGDIDEVCCLGSRKEWKDLTQFIKG